MERMPRQARLDAPGVLHHVMQRGVARGRVFGDRQDYEEFLRRLGAALKDSKTSCYAWCLMSNHIHFLLRTGSRPIGRVLQSVLGGYAGYFNRRYRRIGHVFQGRFKSILCEEEPYFLDLVRYIHLNPLRAGVVRDMNGLDRYPWSGHWVLMGRRKTEWQDVDEVLGRFGKREGQARAAYRSFVAEGIAMGRRRDLEGGGLIRSAGGLVEVLRDRGEERRKGDERVLGSDSFIEAVMGEVEKRDKERARLRKSGLSPGKLLERAARAAGTTVSAVKGRGRNRRQSEARALFSKWMVGDLGYSGAEVAAILGVTRMAVRKAVARGITLALSRKQGLG
jgi:putative transposase